MRLFVSIDLPEGLAEPVAAIQDEFAGVDGLSFVDPHQAHVTLKFLGDVDDRRLQPVKRAVSAGIEDAEVDQFDAKLGGLGVFPNREYIKVLWLGVRDGGDRMTRLHEGIELRTTDIGFSAEEHAFTPHVTLARMTHGGGKERLLDRLDALDPDVGTMRVGEVHLTKSELGSDGPTYSTVARFRL